MWIEFNMNIICLVLYFVLFSNGFEIPETIQNLLYIITILID